MGNGLKMKRYWISESHFSINPSFFNKVGATANIEPELSQRIKKIDENNVEVEITVKISKNETSPFDILVSINGFFECPDWENDKKQNDLLIFTSLQTLYPYLRQAVSTLTGTANIAPYILPLINVYDFIKGNNVK